MVVVVKVKTSKWTLVLYNLTLLGSASACSTIFQQLFRALNKEKNIPYLNKTFPLDLVLYAGASNNGFVEDGVKDISGDKFDCGVLKQDEASSADWEGVSIGIGY